LAQAIPAQAILAEASWLKAVSAQTTLGCVARGSLIVKAAATDAICQTGSSWTTWIDNSPRRGAGLWHLHLCRQDQLLIGHNRVQWCLA